VGDRGANESQTQTLHRLTSYEPGRDWDQPLDDPRILQDLVTNDVGRLPWFYKRYDPDLPSVSLPRELLATTPSAVEVLAGTAHVEPVDLDLRRLASILHLSAGVVRTTVRPYGTWLFRAAGSAGGRFPLELYVAVPEGGELPAGVHWYHPEDHRLVTIGPPPNASSAAIVVTGVPWRTGWRYRERGYRHVYWDAGTMLAQLLAVAESAGVHADLYTGFPDTSIAALVGANGVDEWPVAVVALGDGTPRLDATGPAIGAPVDAAPIELPLATSAQRAGDRDGWGHVWPRGAPVDVGLATSAPVEQVVLSRGSQRLMDGSRGLSEDLLSTSMAAAMRGIDVPHFVVIHHVGDVAPGVYRWPDLATAVRTGPMRDELYTVCLEQDLGRDAAFVVIGATDVGALDDRGYREAQLAAGLVEGRLHLLAYALGAGASGMTFDDALAPAVIGAPLDALLFTCVGVPEYRSATGGAPGAPTDVKMVVPRMS
jgi:SagB-type dehydrogenase family enzyme